MTLKELNEWFDRLEEPRRLKVFLTAMLGWFVPLLLSDMIRPYNEELGIALGIIGGCWVFVIGIIGLERAFGVHVNRK